MRFPRRCGLKKRVRSRDEDRLNDGSKVAPLGGNREVCAKQMDDRARKALIRRKAYGKQFNPLPRAAGGGKSVADTEASTEGTPE